MPLTVEAIYENGVLRPAQPLPFQEHQKVSVTVSPIETLARPAVDEAESAVRRSYGLLGWTGDPEIAHRVAVDPEFSSLESP